MLDWAVPFLRSNRWNLVAEDDMFRIGRRHLLQGSLDDVPARRGGEEKEAAGASPPR
jgi:hypothetical protein